MKAGEESHIMMPNANQPVINFNPFSEGGATTQMGEVPRTEMLSDGTSKMMPVPINPRGGMYLNMEQVHRANQMEEE